MSGHTTTEVLGRPDSEPAGPILGLWLPAAREWPAAAWSTRWANLLGRADRLPLPTPQKSPIVPGFTVLPADYSEAAVSRHGEADDAARSVWLYAAPCHLRVEPTGLRMLACDDMGLTNDEAEDLIAMLKPLFGDFGYELLADTPKRWYLRLAEGASAPQFSPPQEVLGADIGAHLPPGPAGLRWRHLLNEIQISLHPHRRNAERSARGQLPVNSLWFWGGGSLPNRVQSMHQSVVTTDPLVLGLARLAGATTLAASDLQALIAARRDALIDLRTCADCTALTTEWLEPLAKALASGRLAAGRIYFADGPAFVLRRRQRWRFWRRAQFLGAGR